VFPGPFLTDGKGRLGANGAHGSSPLLHDRLPRTLIDSNHTHYVLKAMIRTRLVSVQEMGIVESTYFVAFLESLAGTCGDRRQSRKSMKTRLSSKP